MANELSERGTSTVLPVIAVRKVWFAFFAFFSIVTENVDTVECGSILIVCSWYRSVIWDKLV